MHDFDRNLRLKDVVQKLLFKFLDIQGENAYLDNSSHIYPKLYYIFL